MKSITSGLCIAFAASILGSLGCGAAEPNETVAEVQEPLNISNWNGLVGMASSGSYVLTANIDAAGRTWTPKVFSGSFDGANYTISNLTINSGSFFASLTNADVRRIRFTNLRLTGSAFGGIGGLASNATNTTIRRVSVEADIDVSAIAVGGLVGAMTGGSIKKSYAKGTIDGQIYFAGGLVGQVWDGETQTRIEESYAQVRVNPDTSDPLVVAGGLVGSADAPIIYDAYAVGDVTGRGAVGGIVGQVQCLTPDTYFHLMRTIYRGEVRDLDRSAASGGWAGTVGTAQACSVRAGSNYYDRTLDPSPNYEVSVSSSQGFTTAELREPTTVTGGVFCEMDSGPDPTRCGDAAWSSPPWTPGSSIQHHVLMDMPGPNVQPR
jgi:hypothetical protein